MFIQEAVMGKLSLKCINNARERASGDSALVCYGGMCHFCHKTILEAVNEETALYLKDLNDADNLIGELFYYIR